MFSPVIEEVSNEYAGRVKFVKLNADENEKTVDKYRIMSIPTTLLIVRGKLRAMNAGAVPKATLEKWIDSNL